MRRIELPPQMKFLSSDLRLLIRQENRAILSHPFPQETQEWMGHPYSIELPDQSCSKRKFGKQPENSGKIASRSV
jgi:hypothetical protein